MAELHLGELLRSLQHEGLMAEGVGKDQIAAGVHQLGGSLVALVGLGDVALEHHLILGQAQLLGRSGGRVHEVLVVGGVLIVQEDETDLEIGFLAAGSGAAGQRHDEQSSHQYNGKQLFHRKFSSNNILCNPIPGSHTS